MASYAIFEEKYYLSQYPWVKPAIDAGAIKSGLEHFEKFGQAAGLTKISRYFDEATYLAGNPDIAALVRTANNPNAAFATGLDHFIKFGYEEGRSRVSPEYNEAFYLANNRQLQPFIQNGTFKNGYQHFIQFGIKDGQFGTSFFEPDYLVDNPDVRASVNFQSSKTGREHYFNFGKNNPEIFASFVGTSGNDIITGAGVGNTELTGVEVGFLITIDDRSYLGRNYESDGSNEFDTLTGGSGGDRFVLGAPIVTKSNSNDPRIPIAFSWTQFYIGPGFATIRNFTKGQDTIRLGETFSSSTDSFLNSFSVSPINNNRDLAIQKKVFGNPINGVPSITNFDTIAVIEGGGNLNLNVLEPGSLIG